MTMGSYRPTFIISCIYKINWERSSKAILRIYAQIWLYKCKSICIFKVSFYTNHHMINDSYEAHNEHEIIAASFLDISTCFDTIDHDTKVFLIFPHVLTLLIMMQRVSWYFHMFWHCWSWCKHLCIMV